MKIIASDFDGTLNYGGIDEEKIKALSLWREKGNMFVVVTGRGARDFLNIYREELFPCDYILANNGAVVMDTEGSVLCDKRADGGVVKEFVSMMFEVGCTWVCVHMDLEFFYVYSDKQTAVSKGGYLLEDMPDTPFITQMNIALKDFDEAEKVTALIKEEFGDRLNPLQNGSCIDVVSAGMDKSQGIYMLINKVEACYEDVITVGDNLNDAHMIKEFRSYAMENGVDYIKNIADNITVSVTELVFKELF